MSDKTQDNAAIVNRIYTEWNNSKGGSRSDILDQLTDDIEWRSLADGRDPAGFTASCKGKEGVANYFRGLTENWSMNHVTVDEIIARDDRVIVLLGISWTNRKTGKTHDGEKIDVIRMRDGKICEFAEYYDTDQFLAMAR